MLRTMSVYMHIADDGQTMIGSDMISEDQFVDAQELEVCGCATVLGCCL